MERTSEKRKKKEVEKIIIKDNVRCLDGLKTERQSMQYSRNHARLRT